MDPTFIGYLTSWADEFNSRASRVRQLIGIAHWLSDGAHKEMLLIEFLSRHFPSTLEVGRGFIRPSDPEQSCSPEVDVLITNPAIHPPLFNEGGLVITSPLSVIGHIQSKSTFSATELRNAIANQLATQFTMSRYVDPNSAWRGIIFAEADTESRTCKSIVNTFKTVLSDFDKILDEIPEAVKLRPPALLPELLPKCIAICDCCTVFVSKTAKTEVTLRAFDTKSLSFASFVSDLFSFVCARGAKTIDDLHEMMENVGIPNPIIETIEVM